MWGPTCDGLDCVLPQVSLPDLSPGAWLYFPNMGAYTMAAGSTFNGMPRPRVHHIMQAGFSLVSFEYFLSKNIESTGAIIPLVNLTSNK